VKPVKCTLTARLALGATVPGNGSERASAPLGMVTLVWPLKVTRRLDPGTVAAPDDWCPTWTSSKVAGFEPKAFESRTLRPLPPMLVWTMLRTVVSE